MTEQCDTYIEHLRKVHFTLVIVCFVLTGAFIASDKNEATLALDEFKLILKTVHSWESNWPDSAISMFIREGRIKETSSQQKFWLASDQRLGRNISFHIQKWTTITPAPSKLGEFWSKNRAWDVQKELSLRQPNTFDEFKNLWNALNTKIPIYSIDMLTSKALAMNTDGGEDIVVSLTPTLVLDQNGISNVRLFPGNTTSNGKSRITTHFPNINYSTDYALAGIERRGMLKRWSFRIPVKANRIGSAFAQELFNRYFNSNFSYGNFSDSFPYLDRFTEKLQNYTFEQMHDIIKNETERTGHKLELVGVKLPSQQAMPLGIAALLLIQFYFFLHLREYQNTFSDKGPTPTIPWIGIYRFNAAKFAVAISVLVLPIFSVAVVAHDQILGDKGLLTSGLYISALSICLGISAKTWPCLHSLSENITK